MLPHALLLVVGYCTALSVAQAQELPPRNVSGRHEPRLFSFFNVIRFQNNPCNTTAGNAGVCYTSAECTSKGGTSGGSCAAGYGVCCQFQIGCGQTSAANCTYFVSGETDTSPCTAKICRCNDNICQLRMDFNSFTIAQPDTAISTDATPSSRTECHNAWFTASSDGTNPPAICGTNTGYHMYVEASALCNDLTFSWSTSDIRGWNIRVCQIACDDPNKAPEGCTQYFTGTSGTLSSYNYQGGIQLGNQNQEICIRNELGYCGIQYWQTTPTSFQLSGPTTLTAMVGKDCTSDYVQINGPGNYQNEEYCGGMLGNLVVPIPGSPTNMVPATLSTSMSPFFVRFVSDSGETGTATTDKLDKGFQISYMQTATNCQA